MAFRIVCMVRSVPPTYAIVESLKPAACLQIKQKRQICFKRNELRVPAVFGRNKSDRDKYNFFIKVIKKTSPALVNVARIANIPFFSVPIGAGSGFIVESDGIIITNAHVVGKSRQAGIRMHDGQKYQGKVLGLDLVRDIAVLKVDAKKLPTIPMAKPNDLYVGEWVLAMGSPLSLKNTVTCGIVSNLHREGHELGLNCEKGELGYIQTDASINVGNSGGPLLNLNGECVGMNTMMASVGIAFALPTIHILDFIKQVKEHGDETLNAVKRYLGVRMWTLTPDFLHQNRSRLPHLPDVERGVYVLYVEPESPAAVAGLRVNDVIIAIDGEMIESAEQVAHAVKTKDSFVMTVVSDKDQFDLTVEVDIEN